MTNLSSSAIQTTDSPARFCYKTTAIARNRHLWERKHQDPHPCRLLLDILSGAETTQYVSRDLLQSDVKHLMKFGLPSTIEADYEIQYASEQFHKECKSSGIKLIYSYPDHHQVNSATERAIEIIKHPWKKTSKARKSMKQHYVCTELHH